MRKASFCWVMDRTVERSEIGLHRGNDQPLHRRLATGAKVAGVRRWLKRKQLRSRPAGSSSKNYACEKVAAHRLRWK